MSPAELEELIGDCPTLYHMAEAGSWPAIEQNGLLSTSALLELYCVDDAQRARIEETHRLDNITITAPGLPPAVVRDQKPMSDSGLRRALPARLTAADWYRLLNAKVFFWLSLERLHRLAGAAAHRDRAHVVLEVDTRSLILAHYRRIWLCPYNSGCTKPFPTPRDESIFSRIEDYPYGHWRDKRRRRGERVVELVVDHAVPDIANHTRRVLAKRGSETVDVIADFTARFD